MDIKSEKNYQQNIFYKLQEEQVDMEYILILLRIMFKWVAGCGADAATKIYKFNPITQILNLIIRRMYYINKNLEYPWNFKI